jgi:hypothetical protein
LFLAAAEAQVQGIGGGARYVYFPLPEQRDAWQEILDDLIADGEGEPEPTSVDRGDCLFIQPVSVRVGEDAPILVQPENVIFEANFVVDQTEGLSIADNGENVHGGFRRGGEGRTESKQWEIFSAGTLLYEAKYVAAGGLGPNPLGSLTVAAEWAGTSVENFSGEEPRVS